MKYFVGRLKLVLVRNRFVYYTGDHSPHTEVLWQISDFVNFITEDILWHAEPFIDLGDNNVFVWAHGNIGVESQAWEFMLDCGPNDICKSTLDYISISL